MLCFQPLPRNMCVMPSNALRQRIEFFIVHVLQQCIRTSWGIKSLGLDGVHPQNFFNVRISPPKVKCMSLIPAHAKMGGERMASLTTERTGDHELPRFRSEEHTSELKSLMRISYTV